MVLVVNSNGTVYNSRQSTNTSIFKSHHERCAIDRRNFKEVESSYYVFLDLSKVKSYSEMIACSIHP